MGWHGHLQLDYRRAGDRSVLHDRHEGPLRVLQSLHPEGPSICHNVLVHPPGGVAGGDELRIDARVGEGTHALLTTAGATRFYRTAGERARQSLVARVAAGARLEWLPLESIAYDGCDALNELRFELEPGAESIGWDVLALGLPASSRPFERGRFEQRVELPGCWLERGVIEASDRHLLDSPLGFAGFRTVGALWFACGAPMPDARRERLLEAARAVASEHALARTAGATSTQPEVVVIRVLGPGVEAVVGLLTAVWKAWRREAWQLEGIVPRVWRT